MGKTVMYTLMFLCLLVMGAMGQFPPAGADTYGGNNGNIRIEVFGISPIEMVALSGSPVTIQRSAPADPGDGREEIQTEIIALNLTGVAPVAGPMTVFLNSVPPAPPSKGMIKANAPGPDYPAASFFDVFVDISLTALGLDLINQIPIHIMNPGLTSIPWPGQTHTSITQQIDLFDRSGALRGRLYYFDWTPIGCPPGPPFCDSVQTDPCLLVCPKSDIVFKVVVKDSCGNPICDPATWLDFSQCPVQPCPGEEPFWPRVFPDSCNPTTGVHYFTVDASLLDCTVCEVGLFVHDKFCRFIPAHFFDINNDKCVTSADFVTGPCNDYDCNGVVDIVDFSIFSTHLGHCCPTQPCPPGPAFCDSTQTDPCLLICPKSDLVYKVILKDSCGNPVCAPTSLWLDFGQCPSRPCPNEEPNWPQVFPDSCHAATGEHYFTIDASELDCFDCSVGLFLNGALCRIVKARFFDVTGDGCVTPIDFMGGPCNDYDCDGQITASDRLIFDSHLGHCCNCDCRPGDANGTGTINIQDITYLINFLYKGGPAPVPYALCAGDANCDCHVNIQDISFLINRLYKNGPAPCTCEEWILKCGTPLRH